MNGDEIHVVTAFRWTCADCHDTGHTATYARALIELAEHREDYH